MKRLLASLCLWPVALVAAENLLPQPLSADRYEKGLGESPFALATKVEAPSAPQESFAANLILTGVTRYPGPDGQDRDYVSIRSRDNRIAFSLFGSDPSTDPDAAGITLSKVERSDQPGKRSTVTLKKGTEIAKIEFSQEAAAAAGPVPPPNAARGAVPGQVNAVVPGARPNMPGMPNALVRPQLARPIQPQPMGGSPIVPNNLQNNPGAAKGPWPQQNGLNPQANDRHKIRVINNHP